MKVVLHVGYGKTGTSSIQKALADSSAYLERNGFLYPVLDGHVNHNYLAAPFRECIPRGMLQRCGSRQRVLMRAERLWKTLARRARRAQHHTLILSAEALMQANDTAGFCARLHAEIPLIRDVKIVVYLRRPSSLFAARTQQLLRASSKIRKPTRQRNAPALRAWGNHGVLTISEFYRPMLKDQDVVSDFWHKNIPAVAPRLSTGRVAENISLSSEGMALLQRYRRIYCADRDGEFLPRSNTLMQLIGQVEKSNADGIAFERPSLHDDIRDFIDYATADNEELANEFDFRFTELETGQTAPALKPRSYATVEDLMKVDSGKLASLHGLLTQASHLPFSRSRKVVSQLREMKLG